MPNDNIETFLNKYVENPDPRYAVMLKGKWGCGKSFFIDGWLKNYQQPAVEASEEDIVLKPIKVTLYGLTKTEQITTAIDRELHPILYSKGMKVAKKILNVVGKIAFRTSLDVDGNDKDETSFSASLDSLSLFDGKDDNIKGVRFLIFDDLERCQVDMKQLLGYINYFVEHCGCHVVLIGDEMRVEPEQKKLLDEFKEKTVGREFEVAPDVEAAVTCFLEEDLPRVDWLTVQRDLIIRVFKATGCDNLRILRQCLYDFKAQFLTLNANFVANDQVVLKNLLGNFISVYCEYKGKNRELIKGWQNSYFWGLMSDNDTPEKIAIREMQQKYSPEKTGGIDVLNTTLMPYIVYHLESGDNITAFIENHMRQDQAPLTIVDKLALYYNMGNDEFVRLCQETESMLFRNEMPNLYILGRAVAFMALFHAERLYWMTEALIARVKYHLADMINSQTDKEKLYELRASYISGVQSIQSRKHLTVVADITQYCENVFYAKEATLTSRMEQALMDLSDGNVGQLENLDKSMAPNRRSEYSMTPIFHRLDPVALAERIRHLNNEGKRTFALFLTQHYLLFAYGDGTKQYEADHDVIARLRDEIAEDVNRTQHVERYAYDNLLKVLDAAEKRCGGDRSALIE